MSRLEMFRGDTATFDVAVLDVDGVTPLDLTDCDLTFTAKYSLDDSDANAVFQKTIGSGITVATPSSGTAVIVISGSDTTSVRPGVTLRWDLQVTDTGENDYTLASGALVVKGDVTRS